MELWIIPHKDRKNQNLTISITNTTNIVDLEANQMHISTSRYPLKFVDAYSSLNRHLVKYISYLCKNK